MSHQSNPTTKWGENDRKCTQSNNRIAKSNVTQDWLLGAIINVKHEPLSIQMEMKPKSFLFKIEFVYL